MKSCRRGSPRRPYSYQPLGVLVTLVNLLLGEMVFGGLGTGIYGIITVALVGVLPNTYSRSASQ